jgi:hypothetical protein
MCFFTLARQSSLESNKHFSLLKILTDSVYSLQKLNLFSEGNNVLDAATSNLSRCLFRFTCISTP